MARQSLELVRGRAKRQTQPFGEPLGHCLRKSRRGIKTSAYSRSTDRQLMQLGQAGQQGVAGQAQLGDITAKFLAEAKGDSVLEVGAANLEQRGKLSSPGLQAGDQVGEVRQKYLVQLKGHGDMHCRGEGVVT